MTLRLALPVPLIPRLSRRRSITTKTREGGTELETNNDPEYWRGKLKGYIVEQITKRGHRTDMKKLARMNKEQLVDILIRLPLPP